MAFSAAQNLPNNNLPIVYDSTSDAGESDASTCEDGSHNSMGRLSTMARVRSLQQENTVLKIEVDTLKLRCKNLKEENEELRRARVNLQARAEQEEEYISNTLLRKIQSLKKEKEVLATTYEQEEEYLTNDLSRKLAKLREEKMQLENTLEVEQQNQIARLMKKIERLEHETCKKQTALEQLRRDKVDLENYLEQEQEQLVNKLWKQMDNLENQKQDLINQLQNQADSSPSPLKSPPSTSKNSVSSSATATTNTENHRINNGCRDPGAEPGSVLNASKVTNVKAAAKNVTTGNEGVFNPNEMKSDQSGALSNEVSGDTGGEKEDSATKGSKVSGRVERDSVDEVTGMDTNEEDTTEEVSSTGELSDKVDDLRNEVHRLKRQLKMCQLEHARKMEEVGREDVALRAEKLLLERKLAREKERSDALNKQLSESESSLEIDDERLFNVSRKSASSPIPVVPNSPLHHRSISGGLNIQVGSPVASCGANSTGLVSNKCLMCGTVFPAGVLHAQSSTAPISAGAASSSSSSSSYIHSFASGGGTGGAPTNVTPCAGGVGGNFTVGFSGINSNANATPTAGGSYPLNGGSSVSAPKDNAPIAFFPTLYSCHTTPQRVRLISGSSTTSQKSPRGSFLNESTGSGQF